VAGVVSAVVTGRVLAVATIAVAFFFAHLLLIPNPEGRSLSLSPMVAVALLLVHEGPMVEVLAGAAVGMPAGWWLVRARSGPRAVDHLFPAEAVALLASSAAHLGGHLMIGDGEPAVIAEAVLVIPVAVAWYLTAAVMRALWSGRRRRVARRLLWWEALRDGPAYASLFAAGALFGITFPEMGWWAIPLAFLPYGFSHLSLSRLADTRRTYGQTIRALGKIPEAGSLVPDGHAERTARLAATIGADLGLAPAEVQRVEYAGLLHDVGRVALNDPAVAAAGYGDTEVAAWGAAIIREAPSLEQVAALVADQCLPYRRPGEARDPGLPRAAQAIRVAAAYDRAVHDVGMSPVQALEVLHAGAAYEYDPEVVAALRRALRRRSVPGV
jgi:hypothetical protein